MTRTNFVLICFAEVSHGQAALSSAKSQAHKDPPIPPNCDLPMGSGVGSLSWTLCGRINFFSSIERHLKTRRAGDTLFYFFVLIMLIGTNFNPICMPALYYVTCVHQLHKKQLLIVCMKIRKYRYAFYIYLYSLLAKSNHC